MARRLARELAFRTLFQSERGASELLEVWHGVRSEALSSDEEPDDDPIYGEPLDVTGLDFAEQLLTLYAHNRESIDAEIERYLEGWTFTQMSQTDLNVLRLATTEMRLTDSPPLVVIEMAVRLAKKFGGEESGRFVNGVLAKLLRAGGAPQELLVDEGGVADAG